MHVFDSVTAQAATQEKKIDDLSLNEVAAAIPRRADNRCRACGDGKCKGKTEAPAYLMAHTTNGRKRSQDVTHSRWLVVDWDSPVLPDVPAEHIAVETHRGRWHIIVRLSRDAGPAEYRATAQAFAARWGDASDDQTRHIERALYAPHPEAQVLCKGEGSLEVEKAVLEPTTAPQLPKTRKTPSRKFRDQWVSAMVASPNGNNWLAGALGGVLARNCGYTNEEIAQTMHAWLGGVDPKFDKHIDDATRAADSAREGKPIQGIPKLAEAGIEFSLDDEWPEAVDDTGLNAVFGRLWTARDMANIAIPPIAWVSERWAIAPGAPVVLAGAGGLGKTLLAQALAIGVGTPGGQWLGEDVGHGPVIHIDHEQGLEGTMRRYQRLGVTEDAALGLRCPPSKGWRLAGERSLEWLEELAQGAKLVVIDSLRASLPGVDENDSDIRRFLDPLGEIAARVKAAILVIHHARKTGKDEPLDGPEFLRGSSGITDAASAVIGLARKGEFVEMWLAKIRDPGEATHGLGVKHSIILRNDEHRRLHIENVESRALALQTIANAPDDLTQDEIDALVGGMRDQDKRRHYYDTHPNSTPAKSLAEKRAKHARRKAKDIA